ncbi:DUF4935 domain-containing protein [Bacillus cereus group sp. N12]|uniref:PIN-like domain-containing protein n=1 Tax=Bacillus cereus group sp. N12 TaxID=2794586 RepID=UPI0018F4C882|nr:PIN domain-containing protein [Bacillus cereus group sp. N12]MBJ8078867.1 DUF4935 domain-containing protein [Bacillus cereus group sp. N12]
MKSYEKYFMYQPDLKELYDDKAIIVPDTNFLLMAYQWRNVTTDEVKNVLEGLNKENRLKIPEQVLHEFSKNRQTVLLEQIASIDNELNKIQNPKNEIKAFMPTAETSEEIIDAQNKSESLLKAVQEYKKSLKKVKEKITALITHDEYFEFIKELCQGAFLPYSKDKDILREEGLKRISRGIKPGTDENKNDPTGDYIIWSEIMNLKRHIIFVSNDQKKDWIYKNNNGQQLGVDQTLLSEFYTETEGKYFLHVLPKKFIKFMVPELEKVVEEDLDKVNIDPLSYSISSSKIGFGDKQGDVNRYWQIKLNRTFTPEDTRVIRGIFDDCGYEQAPMVFMHNEDDDTISIIADCSNMIMPLTHDDLLKRMYNHFDRGEVTMTFVPRRSSKMPEEPYQLTFY